MQAESVPETVTLPRVFFLAHLRAVRHHSNALRCHVAGAGHPERKRRAIAKEGCGKGQRGETDSRKENDEKKQLERTQV